MLAVTTELDPLLKRIAEACCAMLGCDRSSIFLYDELTDELWTKVALQSGEIACRRTQGSSGTFSSQTGFFITPNRTRILIQSRAGPAHRV